MGKFVSDTVPTRADFDGLARRLGAPLLKARKTGCVRAAKLERAKRIVTRWNGTETVNDAESGDFEVTNLDADDRPLRDAAGNVNTYVIGSARFPELYEPIGRCTRWGEIYRAKSVVQALKLDQGFDILAPWGQRQRADSGFLILSGDEVYGNNAETFEATYEVIAS